MDGLLAVPELGAQTVALGDLLARGFFPKELPSPFVTTPFANLMISGGPFPEDFCKTATKSNKFPIAKPGQYSLARGGLFRRILAICNPLQYYMLSKQLMESWAEIAPHVVGTMLAATAPDFKTEGRAIDSKLPQGARLNLAQDTRIGKRFMLQTDINRFYGSVYTHSIPWALHGKTIAKANRSLNLLGNKIDYWVRMGQDQQTMGIPIGPDTSLILAELIMQRCDEVLISRLPRIKGYRFIDDYELSFETRSEAEEAYYILENCISEYELTLNTKKTEIFELPLLLERPWATEVKLFEFRTSQVGQAADLANYFSKVFSLHNQYPGESVLQFAIARFRSIDILPANWAMFQKLLLLCVTPEPATFPYVLEQIIAEKNATGGPVIGNLEEVANDLIRNHSRLRHSSEVANAAWACLALRLKLADEAVDSISGCDDPVVALLALHCEQEGLTSSSLDKTLWASHMTSEGLYDEFWLLAYEANLNGWLPNPGGVDFVGADPNFGYLKTNNIYFYDATRATAAANEPIPLPTVPTMMTLPAY